MNKKNKDHRIADTELEIMKAVWHTPLPAASSDIVKQVKHTMQWKETTIYTLLSRLVEKGFLKQEKQKQVSCYYPTITEQEYAFSQTRDFIDKLFGGDAKQLISMLYENHTISADELEKLRHDWEGDQNV